MLPRDVQDCKAKAKADGQSQIDGHLHEIEPKVAKIKYTDILFKEVAIKWLVATDQPIAAFEHPKFKHMIYVVSQAQNGVKIPDCRQMREAIIDSFKKQMNHLHSRLNSPAVTGVINLTCDAWQALNVDGYFTVTGSWIEE
ncbi:hypothetical protein C0991_006134 [Blastosporella zonata]|nr:hypothetical protein C0991_006134 [Blastosporella zonata]